MSSRRVTPIAALVLATLVLPTDANAVGEERVGTSMGTFLRIGVGAKAAGLGEAFTAIADDPTALYWNPAGLANLYEREVYFSHTEWFADIGYEYFAYVQPAPYLSESTIGIHVGALSTKLEETDEFHPYGTGREFTYSDFFIGVGMSQRFTDKLSLGVGAKFIREDFGGSIGAPSVMTWTADFGTYYHLGTRDAVFSVALLNFGPDWRPGDSFTEIADDGFPNEREFESFSPPTSFKVGLSSMIWEGGYFRHLGVIEMSRPPDNAENYRIASEVSYHEMVYLRGGYSMNSDELKWSGGIGLRFRAAGLGERIDYAFTASEYLGRIDRISAGVKF